MDSYALSFQHPAPSIDEGADASESMHPSSLADTAESISPPRSMAPDDPDLLQEIEAAIQLSRGDSGSFDLSNLSNQTITGSGVSPTSSRRASTQGEYLDASDRLLPFPSPAAHTADLSQPLLPVQQDASLTTPTTESVPVAEPSTLADLADISPAEQTPVVAAPSRRMSTYMAREPSTRSLKQLGNEPVKARDLSNLKKGRPLPPAIEYKHIKLLKTPGERAKAYAAKINDLARESTGLEIWLTCTQERRNGVSSVKGTTCI